MSDLEIWLTIAFLTLATFITRSGFWVLGSNVQLPQRVQNALRYAPACALVAIIVPDLLLTPTGFSFSFQNPRLLAGIAATIFFLVRRDMLQTLLFGMILFTGLRLYWS